MAWMNRFEKLPSGTLNLAAGVVLLAGCSPRASASASPARRLIIAAEVVILAAGLVPSLVDLRDTERHVREAARPQVTTAAIGWRAPEWDMENIQQETSGGRLVWIEPQADWHRVH